MNVTAAVRVSGREVSLKDVITVRHTIHGSIINSSRERSTDHGKSANHDIFAKMSRIGE